MAAAENSLETHDLRGPAVDYRREKTRVTKWALGERHLPNGQYGEDRRLACLHGPLEATGRPIKRLPQSVHLVLRREREREMARASRRLNKASRHDILDEKVSAGSEDDCSQESSAPSSDEGITYSYDAPCGPRRGSHVLRQALVNAVVNFEGKQTDKLIKEQYEVVIPEIEAPETKEPLSADLDGFELL